MDVRADIERVRSLAIMLQNWGDNVNEKRLDAMWGYRFGMGDTKVQTSLKIDRMENAIIDMHEMGERMAAVFAQYLDEQIEFNKIINQYAEASDITILYRYSAGCDLSEIPLKGKQKNPKNVVNGAIRRLQATVDREEEVAKQPEAVQKLIHGSRVKCKHCLTGYWYFESEDPKKYFFRCDGCGKRMKADKIGERKNDEHV